MLGETRQGEHTWGSLASIPQAKLPARDTSLLAFHLTVVAFFFNSANQNQFALELHKLFFFLKRDILLKQKTLPAVVYLVPGTEQQMGQGSGRTSPQESRRLMLVKP